MSKTNSGEKKPTLENTQNTLLEKEKEEKENRKKERTNIIGMTGSPIWRDCLVDTK